MQLSVAPIHHVTEEAVTSTRDAVDISYLFTVLYALIYNNPFQVYYHHVLRAQLLN